MRQDAKLGLRLLLLNNSTKEFDFDIARNSIETQKLGMIDLTSKDSLNMKVGIRNAATEKYSKTINSLHELKKMT